MSYFKFTIHIYSFSKLRVEMGRMKMQVWKNQVPGGGIIKYDCAGTESVSMEKASTNVQRRKVQVWKSEVRLSWG